MISLLILINCLTFFWSLWKTQNDFIFDGALINPLGVVIKVDKSSLDFWKANSSYPCPPLLTIPFVQFYPTWFFIPKSVHKINVDTAMDLKNCKGAFVVIVRDHISDLFTGVFERFPGISAPQIEV